MNELIETQVIAIRIACGHVTALHLKALQTALSKHAAFRSPSHGTGKRRLGIHKRQRSSE